MSTAGPAVPQHTLRIPRGATWPAHGWVLLSRTERDAQGNALPLRAISPDTPISAKIRRHPRCEQVVHTFDTALVAMVLADTYGPDPVIVAQLGEIAHTVTATWDLDYGAWDLLVDHRLTLGGDVIAPLVVSR